MPTLFDPLRCGAFTLANRVVMAPLTRNRADAERVPTSLMRSYYEQRASAGLIISEATQISPQGQGYRDTPGMYSDAQVQGWRTITDAVHAQGGRMVAQLWHVGRISHVSLQPGGASPVSSTAVAAGVKTLTANGFESVSVPRPLRADELPGVVDDYRRAAANAVRAGFDGVEVHSANGYLIDQFLRDSVNDRHDDWGGARENRVRLLVEVMRAVAAEIGADRTGVRLSPIAPVNGAPLDSDPQGLFGFALQQLAPLKLAFVHVVEGSTGGPRDSAPFDWDALRAHYRQGHDGGSWIVNNGYTRQMALDAVAGGHADAVAFGKAFISNPDLVDRLQRDLPLAPSNRATYYGGGAEGYTDYARFTS